MRLPDRLSLLTLSGVCWTPAFVLCGSKDRLRCWIKRKINASTQLHSQIIQHPTACLLALVGITPSTFIHHHRFHQEITKGRPMISPLSTSEIELCQRLFLCWCVKTNKKTKSCHFECRHQRKSLSNKLSCTVHTHWTQPWWAAASVREVKKKSHTFRHTHPHGLQTCLWGKKKRENCVGVSVLHVRGREKHNAVLSASNKVTEQLTAQAAALNYTQLDLCMEQNYVLSTLTAHLHKRTHRQEYTWHTSAYKCEYVLSQ